LPELWHDTNYRPSSQLTEYALNTEIDTNRESVQHLIEQLALPHATDMTQTRGRQQELPVAVAVWNLGNLWAKQ